MAATGIGSLPHRDAGKACELTLAHLDEAPVWPQLPHRDFRENMYAQYSEGMPGVVVDEEKEKVWCDTTRDLLGEVEEVYRAYLEDDLSVGYIGKNHAEGLHLFLERVEGEGKVYPLLKGQVTGPFSYGLTVLNGDNRPLLYNDQVADAMVRVLNLKARWMEGRLRKTGAAREVLIFFDEPYLVSVGSALVGVVEDQVVDMLRSCREKLGCRVGAHCCGNTDWTLLFKAGMEVVNFDAYRYMESMALYPAEVEDFLRGGGVLAWGLVPNDADVRKVTADDLARRFEEGVELLASRGVSRELLWEQALITPSCGLEGVDEEDAERAYSLASELSGLLRGRGS